MLESIKSYLREINWVFALPPDSQRTLLLGFGTNKGRYNSLFNVEEDKDAFLFTVFYPFIVPSHLRNDICVLINKVNSNIYIGNFILDSNDGQVKFNIGTMSEKDGISFSLIEGLIRKAVTSVDVHLEIFQDFAQGKSTLEASLKRLDNLDSIIFPG